MKVWVVIPYYVYEGYGEPVKAFSDFEMAELYRQEISAKMRNRYDAIEVDFV